MDSILWNFEFWEEKLNTIAFFAEWTISQRYKFGEPDLLHSRNVRRLCCD